MSLESGTFVDDLVATNPVGASDFVAQGDDHLRLIKSVLKGTFPNATKAFRFPVVNTKVATGSIAATEDNSFALCDASSASITLTLPTLASGDAGWSMTLVKSDTSVNIVSIVPPSGNVNQAPVLILSDPFTFFTIFWDGSGFRHLNRASYSTATLTVGNTITADDNSNVVEISGNGTVTLPASSGVSGQWFYIKRNDASNATILAANGADTIDGAASYTFQRNNEAILVVLAATDWKIVARYSPGDLPASLNAVQTWTKTQSMTRQVLTDAATIAWDLAEGNHAIVTLTADRTLGAPSNAVVGTTGFLEILQDGTGGWELAFNAVFVGDRDKQVSQAAADRTIYQFEVVASNLIVLEQIYREDSVSLGKGIEYDLGTIATGVTETQAHGLGKTPTFVVLQYECLAADLQFAVGDRVQPNFTLGDQGSEHNSQVSYDATNVTVQHGTSFRLMNASGQQAIITAASWKCVIKVFE